MEFVLRVWRTLTPESSDKIRTLEGGLLRNCLLQHQNADIFEARQLLTHNRTGLHRFLKPNPKNPKYLFIGYLRTL